MAEPQYSVWDCKIKGFREKINRAIIKINIIEF